jgi:hypothetical protein
MYCRRASSTVWPVSGFFSSRVATRMPFRIEELLTGLLPVQVLQPGPLLWLGRADEGKYGLRKDRPLAVEAVAVHGYIAVGEEVGFDHGFEGGFAMLLAHYLCSICKAIRIWDCIDPLSYAFSRYTKPACSK